MQYGIRGELMLVILALGGAEIESQLLAQPGLQSEFQTSMGYRMKLYFHKGKNRSWV